MPLRRGRGLKAAAAGSDPLTACLDANGTYICTAFNPRCYIIQKVSAYTHIITPVCAYTRTAALPAVAMFTSRPPATIWSRDRGSLGALPR